MKKIPNHTFKKNLYNIYCRPTHWKNNTTQTVQQSLKLEFIIVDACNSRKYLLDSMINNFEWKVSSRFQCQTYLTSDRRSLSGCSSNCVNTEYIFSFVNINKAEVNTLSPTNHALH